MHDKKLGTWEDAVAWLLSQPKHRNLCLACYYDRPALDAAKRFARSAEWRALSALMPEPHGEALDVGAGMGIASFALASSGWKTVALEPDASDLVGAGAIRRLSVDSGVPIEVVQEWGEKLPFPDARFQLVHARQVLHHARNLPQFCAELYRVLAPGGMLLATREHVITNAMQLPEFLDRHPLHKLYGGENAYPLAGYLGALRQAGFKISTTLGPLQSVINYAPFSEQDVCDAVSDKAARVPGGRTIFTALLAKPWRRLALGCLSPFDRRPGRLYSFIAKKL